MFYFNLMNVTLVRRSWRSSVSGPLLVPVLLICRSSEGLGLLTVTWSQCGINACVV